MAALKNLVTFTDGYLSYQSLSRANFGAPYGGRWFLLTSYCVLYQIQDIKEYSCVY